LQLLTHAQSPELNQNYIKTITKVLYDLVSSPTKKEKGTTWSSPKPQEKGQVFFLEQREKEKYQKQRKKKLFRKEGSTSIN